MEYNLFYKVPTLGVLICRHCKHGVRPIKVGQHLKKKHSMKHAAAIQITQVISKWHEIQHESSAIQIPQALDEPLPIIPCQSNGLLCQRDPDHCQYLAASLESMRNHWRSTHQWSQQTNRGRVSQKEKAKGEAELSQSFRYVSWQQVFPS